MVVFGNRASGILSSFLTSCVPQGPVLVPANICPIVPITLLKLGYRPVTIDIVKKGLKIDPNHVREYLGHQHAAAVIFVHPYGAYDDLADQLFEDLKKIQSDLRIVDDRCLLPPNLVRSPYSDLTLFSTGYSKIVDWGMGGVGVLSEDCGTSFEFQTARFSPEHQAEVDELIKRYQRGETVYANSLATSDWLDMGSMDDITRYVEGLEKETELSVAHRMMINRIYQERIPDRFQLDSKYQLWRFNLLVPGRQQLLERIFEGGFFAGAHYGDVSAFLELPACPNAAQMGSRMINL